MAISDTVARSTLVGLAGSSQTASGETETERETCLKVLQRSLLIPVCVPMLSIVPDKQ